MNNADKIVKLERQILYANRALAQLWVDVNIMLKVPENDHETRLRDMLTTIDELEGKT